mgnify:CR=1 FL=1
MNITEKALIFAAKKHFNQLDDSKKQALNHPIQVARILKKNTKDRYKFVAGRMENR